MCRRAPTDRGLGCAGALTNLHIAVCGGNPETNKIYWKWFCKCATAQHHPQHMPCCEFAHGTGLVVQDGWHMHKCNMGEQVMVDAT